jgi:hypothetical protein
MRKIFSRTSPADLAQIVGGSIPMTTSHPSRHPRLQQMIFFARTTLALPARDCVLVVKRNFGICVEESNIQDV